jgi:hypothetical protein
MYISVDCDAREQQSVRCTQGRKRSVLENRNLFAHKEHICSHNKEVQVSLEQFNDSLELNNWVIVWSTAVLFDMSTRIKEGQTYIHETEIVSGISGS